MEVLKQSFKIFCESIEKQRVLYLNICPDLLGQPYVNLEAGSRRAIQVFVG